MKMKQRILLIDGHSLAYRAFYALPIENFSTSSGQPTNAIYGFASMLINLIRNEKPTHLAAVFDVSRKTFRSDAFPQYKANRESTPDELRSQLTFLSELMSAFRIKSFEYEGFEADDLIATIVEKCGADADVLICTGDRDSFQLITEKVTILYPKKGVTELARIDQQELMKRYGLTPAQYPDFAALRGDPSDNLPSIPGVGEKTAAKWIVDYGSLKNLVAKVTEIKGKTGEALRENINSVLKNRDLTQLRRDVPISVTLEELQWEGIDNESATRFFEKLEIKALRERANALTGSKPKSAATSKIGEFELSAMEFHNKLANETVVAAVLDSGKLKIATRAGLAFSTQLQPNLLANIKVITFQGKGLVRANLGGIIDFDVELAAYLINPGTRDLDLSYLLRKYLDLQIENGEKNLFSTSFTSESVINLFKLSEILTQEMAKRELLTLFRELEMPTMTLLAKMEEVGIGVDNSKLMGLQSEFLSIEEFATKAAYLSAGSEFNVSSPKQLQQILFDKLQLPKTKRIKTGYSTDAESLEWLYKTTKHEVLGNILKIREFAKLRTTVDGLIESVREDSRIHTTFQQTVTATGRLSSTNPNLQNIPIRSEEGRRIRDSFVALPPFTELMTADYSQIEMRIMAHLSDDQGLLKAFAEGEDLHSTVASQVFGIPINQVDESMRRQIKAMSYGLAYGLSSFGLAQQLDIPPNEASALMDRYFQRFGGIQKYLKAVVVQARVNGYTETILGRRRYLPDLNHDNRQRREIAERMALNAPIQGSAADIIKVAMIKVSKSITKSNLKSRLLLQVHDELIFEVAPLERELLEELVRREMGSAYPLKAPLDVNVGFGPSWHQAAH
jgi:DNA polymerase-1